MNPTLKFNFVGILLIISVILFGLSLVITYYDRSIGHYLTNITLFLSSLSFLITAHNQSKKKVDHKRVLPEL